MNKVIIMIMLLVAPASAASGQTGRRKVDAAGDNFRAVMKIERRWNNAFVRHDLRRLGSIMAADYVGTGSHGEVNDKAQELATFKSTSPRFVSFGNKGVEVHVYGDVAVVTGRESLTVLYEGQEVSGEFRYTRVYVERRRRWRLVASHTSKIER